MTHRSVDVAVVGGGIVGLAHAWMARRRGLRTAVFERSPVAQGASVRNFGMIWPIGQPAGPLHALALRARELWLELSQAGVVSVERCGSIHLAHRPDEQAVLEQFVAGQSHQAEMITPAQVRQRTDWANPDGLLAGMWSPTELRVDPRTACRKLTEWLAQRHGVACHFATAVVGIDGEHLITGGGERWHARRIIVCSGSDFETLYPETFRTSGLRRCKLQMLRTARQQRPIDNAPHLASGLTLRHYEAFADCPGQAALRQRIAQESPELDRYGIHVMASPFADGEVVLGDSHQYDDEVTPFDDVEIDTLILRELRKVLRLDDWTIRQRWHGIYAKHPAEPVHDVVTPDGNHVFVGTGGAGMTLSFGLAERAWKHWLGEQEPCNAVNT